MRDQRHGAHDLPCVYGPGIDAPLGEAYQDQNRRTSENFTGHDADHHFATSPNSWARSSFWHCNSGNDGRS